MPISLTVATFVWKNLVGVANPLHFKMLCRWSKASLYSNIWKFALSLCLLYTNRNRTDEIFVYCHCKYFNFLTSKRQCYDLRWHWQNCPCQNGNIHSKGNTSWRIRASQIAKIENRDRFTEVWGQWHCMWGNHYTFMNMFIIMFG